jgi:hypothetical protein
MTETNSNNHISEEQLQELSLNLKYNEEQCITPTRKKNETKFQNGLFGVEGIISSF